MNVSKSPRLQCFIWLHYQYVTLKQTTLSMAKQANCDKSTITRYLKNNGFAIRTTRDSLLKNTDIDLLDNIDWLTNQHQILKKSAAIIAKELGCGKSIVSAKLLTIEATKNGRFPQLKQRNWLVEQYVNLNKSTSDIAKEIGCSIPLVNNALINFNINRKGTIIFNNLDNKSWLEKEYSKKSSRQIANDIGCHYNTVIHSLDKHGIKKRSVSETTLNPIAYAYLSTPDNLITNYVELKKTAMQISNELGISDSVIGKMLRKYGITVVKHRQISSLENKITSILDDAGVSYVNNDRDVISPFELDIVIPDLKIAIEINGVYWHSTKFKSDSRCHEKKRLACEDIGYRLISIYEDDINNRFEIVKRTVLNALGKCNDKKVFARKCTIDHSITKAEAKSFFNKWHIQGAAGSSNLIGLRYNDDIVAIMAFKNNVLTRYATSCSVIGGFSRLLKNNKVNYEKIISFVDLDTFTGDIYKKSGFVFDAYLPPDYKYLIGNSRVHKFNFRKSRFKRDSSLRFDEQMTELQLAALNNIHRVYNSGMIRFCYQNTPRQLSCCDRFTVV